MQVEQAACGGERFYVCVAVVQAVDVFVERGDVDKPGIIYSALYILHQPLKLLYNMAF